MDVSRATPTHVLKHIGVVLMSPAQRNKPLKLDVVPCPSALKAAWSATAPRHVLIALPAAAGTDATPASYGFEVAAGPRRATPTFIYRVQRPLSSALHIADRVCSINGRSLADMCYGGLSKNGIDRNFLNSYSSLAALLLSPQPMCKPGSATVRSTVICPWRCRPDIPASKCSSRGG